MHETAGGQPAQRRAGAKSASAEERTFVTLRMNASSCSTGPLAFGQSISVTHTVRL